MLIPDFGVEVFEGLPGSGKSFIAVRRALEAARDQKRPVYTNLPIKWGKARAWLRHQGGAEIANLIRQLKKPQFEAFIKRFAAKARWRDDRKTLRGDVDWSVVEAEFCQANGPDILDGPTANWIPATALIVIDEAHWWYPMRDQGGEPRELLEYLSMHRHMWHWVWFIVQEKMTLSKSVRRVAGKFWEVVNMAERQLLGPIRFKHLGIRALGYAAFRGDGGAGDGPVSRADPIENFVLIPGLPWNRWVFRLYSSFTHMGTAEELLEVLNRERAAAGIVLEPPPVVDKKASLLGRPLFQVGVALAGLGALVASFFVGRNASPVPPPPAPSAASPAAPEWPRWDGFGDGYAMWNGRKVKVGESDGVWTLALVDPSKRLCGIVKSGIAYEWVFGTPTPRILGDVRLVAAALAPARRSPEQAGAGGADGTRPAPAGLPGDFGPPALGPGR